MKKISALHFVFLIALLLPTSLQASLHHDEDPYGEYEEINHGNFFLMDVNDSEDEFADVRNPDVPNTIPCQGTITSMYGKRRAFSYRRRRHVRLHKGVDIAAPVGTTVTAPAEGQVVFVGRKGGYGLTVMIEHGKGLSTLYAHTSKIFVKEGDYVKRGDDLALVGSTGRSTGPHLHYEVRFEGKPVNPSKFF